MTRWSVVLAVLLLVPMTRRADAQWLEAKSAHYSIFYQAGFEGDVKFARTWLDRAEALMRSKYGVTPSAYRISVYLYPLPNEKANVENALFECCTAAAAGIKTGTIHYLAPSAAAWRGSTSTTSLGLPRDDNYHAKVLMSEYIGVGHYAVQDSRRASGGWRYYSAPEWFYQGLQEFDGISHTTEANHDLAGARLLGKSGRIVTTIRCCSPRLEIPDVYNGGALFLAFLADQFGEDIHARLLRSSAATFDAALASETKPFELPELFERFRRWLNSRAAGLPRGKEPDLWRSDLYLAMALAWFEFGLWPVELTAETT